MITGKLYDWLKWIAQVFLPALGTLYFTLDSLWSIGAGTSVVGTIMAIDLFLGVILGISQINYNKQVENAGELLVDKDGRMAFVVDSDKTDIDSLADKKEVRFAVKKQEGDDVSGKETGS